MKHSDETELADYVREQMTRRGWSLRTLAMYSEVSPSALSAMLRGTVRPRAETLKQVAGALGVDETVLLRLAGHIESPRVEDLDPEAVYLARRLTELPSATRTKALDMLGAQLDTIYELLDEQLIRSDGVGRRLVDTREGYATGGLSADEESYLVPAASGIETLSPTEELERALRLLKRHAPDLFAALYADSAATLEAQGVDLTTLE